MQNMFTVWSRALFHASEIVSHALGDNGFHANARHAAHRFHLKRKFPL